MGLPDLIEIIPLADPVHADITVPGSKSITNRALVLAALAEGEVILRGALWSEDTQVMVECLRELGYMVTVDPDPTETCNRTISVYGRGGLVPRGGTLEQPLELFVGNAGTAARFLAALVCLGDGVYRLHGVDRMHERPQAALFKALRDLGYRIDSPNDRLPALIHGDGSKPGAKCVVSIEESSQFASALLLGQRTGGWQIEIVGENAEESPYVRMTDEMIRTFPHGGGTFQIEPDASSGSYFLAADWIQWVAFKDSSPGAKMDWITVKGWPESDLQIDSRYRELRKFEKPSMSRLTDIADSVMIAIVKAPLNPTPVASRSGRALSVVREPAVGCSEQSLVFTDLGRLRVQETERVHALKTELTKCGAMVSEEGDTLTVLPSALHGAEIETYNDHRMAMSFGVLGLKVPGMKIRSPACVKKTFPNFWQKLAAKPPHGLGATILDAQTRRELAGDELFAD